jgi:hypothetical protein
MNKDALRKLIEAVERGERWAEWGTVDCPLGLSSLYARNAFNGSLDSVKALHEALLPMEWEYALYSPSDSYSLFQVQLETPAMRLAGGFEPVSGEAANPARAWLLAILKAVEAQP